MLRTKFDYNPYTLSITPTRVTGYIPRSSSSSSQRLVDSYKANFEKERTDNLMSKAAAAKLRMSLNWMVYLSSSKSVFVKETKKNVRFRLSFITLTLPSKQIHTATEIKSKCLMNFLQWLRDSAKVKKYIWKAEIQKNGNLHFHITMDKFIHYQRIRRQWNKNINVLGYVDRYTLASGKFCPPSTEIKSVKNVKKMGAYLSAYLSGTKGDTSKKHKSVYNNVVIEGRLWGVSSVLSKMKSLKLTEDVQGFDYLVKYVKQMAHGVMHTDYVHSYYINHEVFNEIVTVYSEIYGFDWLIDSGFDIYDIGLLGLN